MLLHTCISKKKFWSKLPKRKNSISLSCILNENVQGCSNLNQENHYKIKRWLQPDNDKNGQENFLLWPVNYTLEQGGEYNKREKKHSKQIAQSYCCRRRRILIQGKAGTVIFESCSTAIKLNDIVQKLWLVTLWGTNLNLKGVMWLGTTKALDWNFSKQLIICHSLKGSIRASNRRKILHGVVVAKFLLCWESQIR